MISNRNGASEKLTLIVIALFTIAFSGQSCASQQDVIQEPLRLSPAAINKPSSKEGIVVAVWLPGKNHNSHSLACTDEEVNDMGCETLYKNGVAYWCSCPREQGEHEN